MKKLCVVTINYRRGPLTLGCLESLEPEIAPHADRHVCLVDNGSDDGSPDELARAISGRGWDKWITFVRSPRNGGFAYGNNLGFTNVAADAYLLLNSDARVQQCSISTLLKVREEHPDAGLIGPRLQGPEGEAQISAFRFRTPISEMLAAAKTGPLGSLFSPWEVAIEPSDRAIEPQWVSFACVLIPRPVIDRVGLMDEGYFMYFEDIDYARRIRDAGFKVIHEPRARVVHLRGGTSSVKGAMKSRARIPKYYFEARSRYFAKFYGGVPGLVMTNMLWMLGRGVSFARELVGNKQPHVCRREGLDNWTNWLRPMQEYSPPGGGDL
jgi:GT2 family glycosyltransferase